MLRNRPPVLGVLFEVPKQPPQQLLIVIVLLALNNNLPKQHKASSHAKKHTYSHLLPPENELIQPLLREVLLHQKCLPTFNVVVRFILMLLRDHVQ